MILRILSPQSEGVNSVRILKGLVDFDILNGWLRF